MYNKGSARCEQQLAVCLASPQLIPVTNLNLSAMFVVVVPFGKVSILISDNYYGLPGTNVYQQAGMEGHQCFGLPSDPVSINLQLLELVGSEGRQHLNCKTWSFCRSKQPESRRPLSLFCFCFIG